MPDAKLSSLVKLVSSDSSWIFIVVKQCNSVPRQIITHNRLDLIQTMLTNLEEDRPEYDTHWYSVLANFCCPMISDHSDHWRLVHDAVLYLRTRKSLLRGQFSTPYSSSIILNRSKDVTNNRYITSVLVSCFHKFRIRRVKSCTKVPMNHNIVTLYDLFTKQMLFLYDSASYHQLYRSLSNN